MTDTERELERQHRATQRLRVISEFREHGRVDVNDMLDLGHPITRTAGVIFNLREEWGKDAIRTDRRPRNTCVYVLVREPEVWVSTPKPRAKRTVRGWYCATCGQRTLYPDTKLTTTAGKSMCGTCRKVTMFWLRRG